MIVCCLCSPYLEETQSSSEVFPLGAARLPGFWLVSGGSWLSTEPVVQVLWEAPMSEVVFFFLPTRPHTHTLVSHSEASWTVRFDEPLT